MTKEKIHPYKFSMWIGIASMTMLFAGITSAYIVRSSQSKWVDVQVPKLFLFSTLCIVASSVTLHFAIKKFRERSLIKYNLLLFISLALACLFVICQIISFYQMQQNGILLSGNVSGSFVYLLVSLHLLHIIGGLFALFLVFIIQRKKEVLIYSTTALEVVAMYWHFVDILWIYLVVFYFIMLK